MHGCKNISLNNCNLSKLKYFYIGLRYDDKSFLDKIKIHKCPELETILISNSDISIDSIIDVKSLSKLKIFNGNLSILSILADISPLQKIDLSFSIKEKETKIFEKLLSIKTLKEIDADFDGNFNFTTYKINYSITKLKLYINSRGDIDLNNFLKNFPNLKDLIIKINSHGTFASAYTSIHSKKRIIINENFDSKINKISVHIGCCLEVNIKYSIQSYKLLEFFDLDVDYIDFKYIPFFQHQKNTLFTSLKYFNFNYKFIVFNKYFLNLYNNIDSMQNLIDFHYSSCCTIKEKFFKMFIKKILTLKSLKNITIKINKSRNLYSKNDLKKLLPDINFNKFNEINIFVYKEHFELSKYDIYPLDKSEFDENELEGRSYLDEPEEKEFEIKEIKEIDIEDFDSNE